MGRGLRSGTAAVCLLSEHMTTVRQRIETSVPRKRKGGTSGHDKVCFSAHYSKVHGRAHMQAMETFFNQVYQAILRLVPFQTLKAIVIASPGFTKDSVSRLLSGLGSR